MKNNAMNKAQVARQLNSLLNNRPLKLDRLEFSRNVLRQQKKHFFDINYDQVQLAPSDSSFNKVSRKNILDVSDIQGAKPKCSYERRADSKTPNILRTNHQDSLTQIIRSSSHLLKNNAFNSKEADKRPTSFQEAQLYQLKNQLDENQRSQNSSKLRQFGFSEQKNVREHRRKMKTQSCNDEVGQLMRLNIQMNLNNERKQVIVGQNKLRQKSIINNPTYLSSIFFI